MRRYTDPHPNTYSRRRPRRAGRKALLFALPAASALAVAFGLVTTTTPAAAATDAPAEASARAVAQEAPATAAVDTRGATPGRSSALDRLARGGVLSPAVPAIVEMPVKICRRVLAHADVAPASLVERCRAWVAGLDAGDDEGSAPHVVCRRVAAALASGETPDPTLVERCRTWLATLPDDAAPLIALCRRVAAADGVDPALEARCRAALAAYGEHRDGAEYCRRVAAAEEPVAGAAERCREWLQSLRDRAGERAGDRGDDRLRDRERGRTGVDRPAFGLERSGLGE